MNKKTYLYIALSLFLISSNAFGNANFQHANPSYEKDSSTLQGYTLYVPTGARVSAVLSQEINSKTATVGQNISAILTEDFKYNGQLIAPSGSVILGSVVSKRKSAIGENAQMQIRFTTIRTPYNNLIPINAIIATSDSTGILRGASTKDSAKENAKDSTVKGESGVVKAVAVKGKDIKIASNSQINIIFDQPITLGAH